MNVTRRFCLLPFAFCLFQLLSSPSDVYGGSREAVKKAIAATVAVEWRADEKDAQSDDKAFSHLQPQLEGVVLAARANGLVEISLGSDDGLRKGQAAYIYRKHTSENKPLANIEVIAVTPDKSIGKVHSQFGPAPIERDDRVSFPVPPESERRKAQTVEIDPQTGKQVLREAILDVRQDLSKADLALASGVVVSADGLIVTLNHEPTEGRHTVVFDDGHALPARVVVDDRRNGLRLLKVGANDLAHLSLADAAVEVGDQVFAAFCTDRCERAAAQGIVAAWHKTGSFQLDLTAGPMSTGGPVIDEQGRLVGIILGGHAPTPRVPTTNFAVPLDAVRDLLAARREGKTVVVQRGFLGVQLSRKADGRERVVVQLTRDSPARAAGMLDGDELVALDGQKLTTAEQVAALVGRHAAGDKISAVVLRDGEEKTLEIILGRPPEFAASRDPGPTGARARPARAARVVFPGKVYILSEDGRLVVSSNNQVGNALRDNLRETLRDLPDAQYEPVPNTIRVERSDLDKKLQEVGHSVESLQRQVQKLTEEIQSLRSELGGSK